LSGKKGHENARPRHPDSEERLYNENVGSESAHPTQSASLAETLRVILPDEPPRLNPAAARALLRILIKAHDRLEKPDNPQGAAE
jgi:hypothetical protein